MKAQEIIVYLESLRNEEQRRVLMGFFKTGPGEYGYGDLSHKKDMANPEGTKYRLGQN